MGKIKTSIIFLIIAFSLVCTNPGVKFNILLPKEGEKISQGERLKILVEVYKDERLLTKDDAVYLTAIIKSGGKIFDRVSLFDDGTHTDENASDGKWGNYFVNTKIAGNYIIKLKACIKEVNYYSNEVNFFIKEPLPTPPPPPQLPEKWHKNWLLSLIIFVFLVVIFLIIVGLRKKVIVEGELVFWKEKRTDAELPAKIKKSLYDFKKAEITFGSDASKKEFCDILLEDCDIKREVLFRITVELISGKPIYRVLPATGVKVAKEDGSLFDGKLFHKATFRVSNYHFIYENPLMPQSIKKRKRGGGGKQNVQ